LIQIAHVISAKTLIACAGFWLIITAAADIIAMVALALTPGVFASTIKEGFRLPTVLGNIASGVGVGALGIAVVVYRAKLYGFLVDDRESAPDSALCSRQTGPLLFQVLALYLIAVNLPSIPLALASVMSSDGEFMRKINVANLLMLGRFNPLITLLFSMILLFRARWVYQKLWPEQTS
jgi:hypothetical protein